MGDSAEVLFVSPNLLGDTPPFEEAYSKQVPRSILSISCQTGGADYLYGDNDVDIIVGGADGDFIYAGDGNDFVAGDCVDISLFDVAYTVEKFESIETEVGGNDTIWLGEGDDYAIGGAFGDTIHGESGMDVIVSIDYS